MKQAVIFCGSKDAFAKSRDALNGWMFWDPKNIYSNL